MIKHAILDLDGTVYRGEEPILGVPETIQRLRNQDIKITFLTNNATRSREEVMSKLERMGIDVDLDEIFTSGIITAQYLANKFSSERTLAVGEDPFFTALRNAGIKLTNAPETADVVVVALDRNFDYEVLSQVLRAFENDQIAYFATNSDPTRPGEDYPRPSTGAILGAIEASTGHLPDQVIGKPSQNAASVLQTARGITPKETVVVGDRVQTDILLGKKLAATTVLVRSGASNDRNSITDEDSPDYILDSLANVEQVIANE